MNSFPPNTSVRHHRGNGRNRSAPIFQETTRVDPDARSDNAPTPHPCGPPRAYASAAAILTPTCAVALFPTTDETNECRSVDFVPSHMQ